MGVDEVCWVEFVEGIGYVVVVEVVLVFVEDDLGDDGCY